MTSPKATLTKTGFFSLAILALTTTATATPASADTVVDPAPAVVVEFGNAAKAIGAPAPKLEIEFADLFDTITVTSTEAPEITVVRPMAEGTYRNTSQYGPRWGSIHTGTDFAARVGTPIFAIADGTVVHAGGGKDGRSGQLVIIHHVIDGQDVWSWYGHMYSDGVYVAEGETVKAGQVIAGVGSNGRSSGPHLHFEIHVGELENHMDPLAFLAGAEAPFPAAA
ncbi:MAG: M23 family metallopeptidase [Actinobacteria bacterium]|nr:M23 family metallopeptidase [Actinomycetota bacterium]